MAHDVFISYSASDKNTADAVCAALEGHKIRCWIAPRDVVPGSDWAEAIVGAITDAKLMVVVFSAHANGSRQVMREVERAVEGGLIIVPLRLEDVPYSKSLGYFLGACHWLDAIDPPLEQHISRLAITLKTLLATGDAGVVDDAEATHRNLDELLKVPRRTPSDSSIPATRATVRVTILYDQESYNTIPRYKRLLIDLQDRAVKLGYDRVDTLPLATEYRSIVRFSRVDRGMVDELGEIANAVLGTVSVRARIVEEDKAQSYVFIILGEDAEQNAHTVI
jgi:hypothetical protein